MYFERTELRRYVSPGILIPALFFLFLAGVFGFIVYQVNDAANSDYIKNVQDEYVIACDLREHGYSSLTDLPERYAALEEETKAVLMQNPVLREMGVQDFYSLKLLEDRVEKTESYYRYGTQHYIDGVPVEIDPMPREEIAAFRKEYNSLYGREFVSYYTITAAEFYDRADSETEKLFIVLNAYYSYYSIPAAIANGETINFSGNTLNEAFYVEDWHELYGGAQNYNGKATILPYYVTSRVQTYLFLIGFMSSLFLSFCVLVGRAGKKHMYTVPWTCKKGAKLLDRSCLATVAMEFAVLIVFFIIGLCTFPGKLFTFFGGNLRSSYMVYAQPMYWINVPYGLFFFFEIVLLCMIVTAVTVFSFSVGSLLKSKLIALLCVLALCPVYGAIYKYVFFDINLRTLFDPNNATMPNGIRSFTAAHLPGIEVLIAAGLFVGAGWVYFATRKKFKELVAV